MPVSTDISKELEAIVREYEPGVARLTAPEQLVAYWPDLEGCSADGLILAYAAPNEGFDACVEQYRMLREELALLGKSPRAIVAGVGARDLEPGNRYDLEIAVDLVRSQELQWVAAAGFEVITDDITVSSTLIGELGGVDLMMLPFEEAADVPGKAGAGELLERGEQEQFAAKLLASKALPGGDWAEAPANQGTYALCLVPEIAESEEAGALLQLAATRGIPIYVGRTLNETLTDRLAQHAERIVAAEMLELGWFTARYIEAPDARLAYRGKRAMVEVIGTAPWQRSGFAG